MGMAAIGNQAWELWEQWADDSRLKANDRLIVIASDPPTA